MTEHNNPQDNITVPRELLRQAYAEIRHLSRVANVDHAERSIIDALRTALEQPTVEPVSHQYQDRDGKWCNFMNEKHYENTKADGRWPIRALYTAPQAQPAPVQEPCIHADLVVTAIEQWKSLWLKVPSFGNKVNKATREAITVAHGPLFKLLHEADAAKRMPAGCTSPSGCHDHGCHGACLPDEAQQPRKAVKLRGEEIYDIASKALPKSVGGLPYVPDWTLPLARSIEQAVWAKLGVTE